MPIILRQAYRPNHAGLPPHLSTQDYNLYLRWLPTRPPDALTFYFDVRLGEGRDPGEEQDPKLRSMWYDVTAKRADLIIRRPESAVIVEFRDHAQANAIGRLMMYQLLWRREDPWSLPVELTLVTNWPDPDVRDIATANGITYVIV